MLIIKKISKKLGEFHLKDIDLNISKGTYYVLLGRSGSGKTQLLELIAGLTQPDSGEIWLNNENITHKKIQSRNIGLVFQEKDGWKGLDQETSATVPERPKELQATAEPASGHIPYMHTGCR